MAQYTSKSRLSPLLSPPAAADAGMGSYASHPRAPLPDEHHQSQAQSPTPSPPLPYSNPLPHAPSSSPRCPPNTFGRELGRGQFGVTYLATHKASGARRACKSIAARKLAHASDAEDLRRDVQIMHHLTGHRSIVELHGSYEDLAMELCEGGEPVLPLLPARLGKSAEEDVQAVEARRPATTRDRSRHSSCRRSLIAFW
nr:calcium-dependent protein kinase 1-like [Lolium perenne]